MFGCIPQREIKILQNKTEGEGYKANEIITERYFLQVNDQLYVQVTTPDPKVSAFFNAQGGTTGQNTVGNSSFYYYPINDRMEIEFPYVGKINLAGCNVSMAKERIHQAVAPMLQEFNLTVRLASNRFVALGEVGSPGVHTMDKDQITIFEALAKCGDIRVYGKRKDVKILRQLPQGPVTYTIDVTDARIVNSEFYYIYPNDVIYVRPMKAKSLGIGESLSFGLITSTLGLGLTLMALLNRN